jgi:hypothetical protein
MLSRTERFSSRKNLRNRGVSTASTFALLARVSFTGRRSGCDALYSMGGCWGIEERVGDFIERTQQLEQASSKGDLRATAQAVRVTRSGLRASGLTQLVWLVVGRWPFHRHKSVQTLVVVEQARYERLFMVGQCLPMLGRGQAAKEALGGCVRSSFVRIVLTECVLSRRFSAFEFTSHNQLLHLILGRKTVRRIYAIHHFLIQSLSLGVL